MIGRHTIERGLRWTALAKLKIVRRHFGAAANFPPPPAQPRRRVVVTGLGIVSPLGVGVKLNWDRLVAGNIAVQGVEDRFKPHDLPSKVAAVVPRGSAPDEFDASRYIDPKQSRAQDVSFIAYALAAAQEALADSAWNPSSETDCNRTDESARVVMDRTVMQGELKYSLRGKPLDSIGVAVGSGMGSLGDIMDAASTLSEKGQRRISPYFIPRVLINMAAGHISMNHKLQGPNHSCVTACATGAHSIGDAFRLVQHGDADVMVAGGTEASINALSIAGFCRAKALSTKYNDNPESASRPFDEARDGFVMGEGAGVVIIEELEHARRRNAKIYAEIRGYGLAGDAFHITQPTPDGAGAFRAMEGALREAGLSVSDIDYINAHATSTPIGDLIEANAIQRLFGQHSDDLAVSSTKGAIGHLLGAAGVVEAIYAIKALQTGVIPPTVNLDHTDPSINLDLVPKVAKTKTIRACLTNSFGFGGTNATLCFAEPP